MNRAIGEGVGEADNHAIFVKCQSRFYTDDVPPFLSNIADVTAYLSVEVAYFVESLAPRKTADKPAVERNTPVFGSAKGLFHMSPDFDDPIDDFKDYQ